MEGGGAVGGGGTSRCRGAASGEAVGDFGVRAGGGGEGGGGGGGGGAGGGGAGRAALSPRSETAGAWNQLFRQLAQRTCLPVGPTALSGTT